MLRRQQDSIARATAARDQKNICTHYDEFRRPSALLVQPPADPAATVELPMQNEGATFLLGNVRSIRNQINAGKLQMQLEETEPDVVLLTETWLDSSTEELEISGYQSIARRDRRSAKKGGGVAILVRCSFRNVGLLHLSKSSERLWATLHTSLGPILIGIWYRPPDEDAAELHTFAEELEKSGHGHIGIFVFCDANVHHQRWLKFPNGNTRLGQDLREFCDNAGLQQIVKEPTRKGHLLDLVLTTMADSSTATVLPSLSDHRAVLCKTKLETIGTVYIARKVWSFREADWDGLRHALKEEDWSYIHGNSGDDAVLYVTHRILDVARKFISQGELKERKSTHPWITQECREAVSNKNHLERELLSRLQTNEEATILAELESSLEKAIKHSNAVMGKAYDAYVEQVRQEIKSLPKRIEEMVAIEPYPPWESCEKSVSSSSIAEFQWAVDSRQY